MRPAQTVDDITVIRLELDRLAHHGDRLGEIDLLVDHRIAEIIEHHRLIGLELKRLPEISLGLVPLLDTLKSNAAIIIDGPVVTLRRGDESDGGIVGIGRRREFLIVAIEIAERHQRLIILRVAVGQRLEQRLRLVLLVEPLQVERHFEFGIGLQDRCLVDRIIGIDRALIAVHALIDVAEQCQIDVPVAIDGQSELGIGDRHVEALVVGKCGRHREQGFTHAGLRRLDERLRLVAPLESRERLAHQRVLLGGREKLLVDLARLVLAAVAFEIIAIGLHDAQRITGLAVGLLVEVFSPQVGAEKVGDQGAMIGFEILKRVILIELVERVEGRGLVALGGVGPGGEECRGQFANRRISGLLEVLARLDIALEPYIAQAKHEARHAMLAVEAQNPFGIVLGTGDLAFRQVEDEHPFDEDGIVGVVAQSLLEILAGGIHVALRAGEAPGKITAGKRGTFNFEIFITCLGRKGGEHQAKGQGRHKPAEGLHHQAELFPIA